MPLSILLPAITLCFVIAYQDFREREIHLIPLGLLLGLGLVKLLLPGTEQPWTGLSMNLLLIGLMVGGLALYFKSKGRIFFDEMFGWGDLVFLLIAATWLSPPAFLLFYAVSTLSALAGVGLLWALGHWQNEATVPLAGWMSLVLIAAFFFPL